MNIAIIGAGLSGLVSGYELLNKNFNIKIFESSDRVGGRIYSSKNNFTNLIYEKGGELIGSNHFNIINLI
jgi:monoamine oxidase